MSQPKYFIRIGTHERRLYEVPAGIFALFICEGYCLATKKPHIANVAPRYRCWMDEKGHPRVEVKEPAANDPHAIASIFALILRLADFKVKQVWDKESKSRVPVYSTLFEWQNQVNAQA